MTPQKQARILFIYPVASTFILLDQALLESEYEVRPYHFKTGRSILLSLFRQLFFLLFNVWRYRAVVCDSNNYHAWLPGLFCRLSGKPLVIIAIGSDCASFPEINYGNFRKQPLARIISKNYRRAELILPVHASMEGYDYTFLGEKDRRQGIRAFVHNLKTTIRAIPYGYDPERWKANPEAERVPDSFLTVSGTIDTVRYRIKGVDTFAEAAKLLPDCSFTIIGNYTHPEPLPPNVTVKPAMPQSQLVEEYSRHSFYMQLSISEGFPNTLCEAMACGCVPIGSRVAAIPDIIDDCGFVLDQKDKAMLKELLDKARRSDVAELSVKSARRIHDNFNEELRRSRLCEAVRSLIRN